MWPCPRLGGSLGLPYGYEPARCHIALVGGGSRRERAYGVRGAQLLGPSWPRAYGARSAQVLEPPWPRTYVYGGHVRVRYVPRRPNALALPLWWCQRAESCVHVRACSLPRTPHVCTYVRAYIRTRVVRSPIHVVERNVRVRSHRIRTYVATVARAVVVRPPEATVVRAAIQAIRNVAFAQ